MKFTPGQRKVISDAVPFCLGEFVTAFGPANGWHRQPDAIRQYVTEVLREETALVQMPDPPGVPGVQRTIRLSALARVAAALAALDVAQNRGSCLKVVVPRVLKALLRTVERYTE